MSKKQAQPPEMSRIRQVPVLAVLLFLTMTRETHAGRLRVCALSFNSPDEVHAFRSRLPEQDFEIVDLSPQLPLPSGQGADAAPASWLSSRCRTDLHCDVVVYSAEFAGRFFGRSGLSVGLQELEEFACQPRCQGLFHDPHEVFLLACNTLATKDQDRRTPAEYLQVLLDHGFDRGAAERVVALRYGPLGPSFREALRRIFMGVPRIYGFSSVAPTGDYTAPMLAKYFRSKGDYRRYLEQAQRDTKPNKELLAAFRGTDLVQIPGLSPTEPAARDRREICALYDDTRSVSVRLQIAARLLDRGDFLAFLPTLEVFVRRHPAKEMQKEERSLFAEIQHHDAARDEVLRLVRELNVSALKMELAHLAVNLEWVPPGEFRRLAIDGARELINRPLTSEVVDIMCEITKHQLVADAFRSQDLPDRLFEDGQGIRFVDCLAPADRRVSARLVPGLDSTDHPTRLWAAYALSRRVPLEDPILIRLASHLKDEPADLRERLRWIFISQAPVSDDVGRAVKAMDTQLAEELRARAKSR